MKENTISIEHLKTQFKQHIQRGWNWLASTQYITKTNKIDTLGLKILNLWIDLYKIVGDCDCQTVGDCTGKIKVAKFLKERGYYVHYYENKYESLDGYFIDENDNKYYMEIKSSNYDLSGYKNLLCCNAKKLKAFEKYGIKQFYMIMIDDTNIYIKNVPVNYEQYPDIYQIKDTEVKATEEFGNDEIIIEKKLWIPKEYWKVFTIYN